MKFVEFNRGDVVWLGFKHNDKIHPLYPSHRRGERRRPGARMERNFQMK